MSFSDASSNLDYLSVSDDSLGSDDSFRSIPPLSLCDSLYSHFKDVPKNFNVVHINAQSIPAHYPDMLTSFSDKNIHAILISESWLKPCLPSTSYSLPGFNLIRHDRTGRRGGGVAIYLRDYIPFSIVTTSSQSQSSDGSEYLFLEILLSGKKTLLGVFYCPSLHINYFPSFEVLLENLVPVYEHTLIMGDFNTCLLKGDNRATQFNSIINSTNLHILPSTATHFFPQCEPSLLDLTLVSSLDHVATHGQCTADAFSFHDLIFLSYKIRPPKNKHRTLLQRNFGAIDRDELLRDAQDIDWDVIREVESVDEKINIFNSLLTKLYDAHAPVRPVRVKHLPAPWLNDEIRTLQARKNTIKAKYKANPEKYREKYRQVRNLCNRMCRDAQRRHIHKSIEDSTPSNVWKFLRTLGVGKQKQVSTSNNLDLNALNLHFSSVAHFDAATKTNTLSHVSGSATPVSPTFLFSQFTDCDVKKEISSIASNAVGCDEISRKMILPLLDFLTPIISHIFNFSISSSSFPTLWKDAQIIPLPKKTNPTSFSEYRPISILPFLSKVLEKLVHKQLSTHLARHNLLNPFQSGFQPGHSTTTALVKVTDDIRAGMEKSQLTILTLLDFSNAFNTVDFDILLAILDSLNVSPTVVDWFRSYLFGRRQRIRLDDRLSSWCFTSAGVPQGGVLSPLLFSIFIKSITLNITSSYHLYADDLQIYTQASLSSLPCAIRATNMDLDVISNWSRNHGLQVNPVKSQSIIIGTSRLIAQVRWEQMPPISFDGIIIPFSDVVRDLGILLDKSLSWAPQVAEVSRKMFAAAGSLRRLRNFLPMDAKIKLSQALLLPILDYADVSYLDLTEEQLNKLERLQNFCIRFVFGLRKYDHVSEFRRRLKWLPIRLRRNTHILSLLYKTLFDPRAPRYLQERFEFLFSNLHLLRKTRELVLKTPTFTSSSYSKSFTAQAVRLWNSLPQNIRLAQTLISFKKLLFEHYFSF